MQQKSAELLTQTSHREWAETTRSYEGKITSLTNQNTELDCELREREAQIKLLTKHKQVCSFTFIYSSTLDETSTCFCIVLNRNALIYQCMSKLLQLYINVMVKT